jgi:hypothetical protein
VNHSDDTVETTKGLQFPAKVLGLDPAKERDLGKILARGPEWENVCCRSLWHSVKTRFMSVRHWVRSWMACTQRSVNSSCSYLPMVPLPLHKSLTSYLEPLLILIQVSAAKSLPQRRLPDSTEGMRSLYFVL